MTDRTEIINAWRAHRKAKGEESASAVIASFCDDADEASPHGIPEDKIEEAIAALREGLPADQARGSAPKAWSDIDTGKIWARFNSAGRRSKPSAGA